MIRQYIKILLIFLIFLSAFANVANSNVSKLDFRRFASEAKKAGISSLDFRIDVIEQDVAKTAKAVLARFDDNGDKQICDVELAAAFKASGLNFSRS